MNLLIVFQGKGQRLIYCITLVVGIVCCFRYMVCARNFGIWLYQKRDLENSRVP